MTRFTKKLLLFSAATVIFQFLLVSTASGAPRYVSTTGTDSGDCTTIGSPCLTIAYVLTQESSGDTIYLCGGACDASGSGTFSQQIQCTNINSGTGESTRTSILVYPGENITLNPTATGSSIIQCDTTGTSYVTIGGSAANAHDLILDAVNTSQCAKIVDSSHHITIQDVECKNAQSNGFLIGGSTGGNIIQRSLIHDNCTVDQSPYGHGIYISGANNTVDGNEIYDNDTGASYGIQIYTAANDASNNVIRNNVIHGHTTFLGIRLGSGTNNTAYNNILYSNSGGIEITSCTSCTVYNNTVYGSSGGSGEGNGLRIQSDVTTQNNILYGNTTNYSVLSGSPTASKNLCNAVGTGCELSGDPLFINVAAGNFHISSSSSPAVDTGSPIGAFNTDRDGTSRPQGNGWDVGAYELGTGGGGGGGVTCTTYTPCDNFDIYTVGDDLVGLNGGAGWTGNWVEIGGGSRDAKIQTAPAGGQGGFAVKIQEHASLEANYARAFTASSASSFRWDMRISTTSANNKPGIILLETLDISASRMYVVFDSSGNIQIYDNGTGMYQTVRAFSADTWYTCTIEWNDSTQPNKYRADCGTGFTSWYDVNGGTYTNIAAVRLNDDSTTVHDWWIDNIGVETASINDNIFLTKSVRKNFNAKRIR